MNTRNIYSRETAVSVCNELDGYTRLGMRRQALTMARKTLRRDDLTASDFEAAVGVFLQLQTKLKNLIPCVEAAYQRLDRRARKQVRSSMLGFYYSVRNWKKAREFAVLKPCNLGDFMFSLDVLTESEEVAAAKRLARRGIGILPLVTDDFSRAGMIHALVNFLAQQGEHKKALKLSEQMPPSAATVFNRAECIVELYAAKALVEIERGLMTLWEAEKKGDPDLNISHPRLHQGLVDEKRKKLFGYKKALEKILPKKEWKDFGVDQF